MNKRVKKALVRVNVADSGDYFLIEERMLNHPFAFLERSDYVVRMTGPSVWSPSRFSSRVHQLHLSELTHVSVGEDRSFIREVKQHADIGIRNKIVVSDQHLAGHT